MYIPCLIYVSVFFIWLVMFLFVAAILIRIVRLPRTPTMTTTAIQTLENPIYVNGNPYVTSWGNAQAPPVFLVHGRQDCAATFEPVLQLLPVQQYYYVAIDMPGSGNSDPLPQVAGYGHAEEVPVFTNLVVEIPPEPQYPPVLYEYEPALMLANIDEEPPAPEPQHGGVKIMRFHFLGAMEAALEHLGWDQFIFMGHSMGCELGLFYNAIYPGKITKMIFLDAEPTLRRLQVQDLTQYQPKFYDDYYNNYHKDNNYYRTYTIVQATEALMRARNLTEEKASILIKKSLIHVAEDQYRFTWDRRLKLPAPQNYPNSYYFALFKNIPPTLLISALGSLNQKSEYKKGSLELIRMLSTLQNFNEVKVDGDHDVHLSHPERVAPYVKEFLTKNVVFQSKL